MAVNHRGRLADNPTVMQRDDHVVAGFGQIGSQAPDIDRFVENLLGDPLEQCRVPLSDLPDLDQHEAPFVRIVRNDNALAMPDQGAALKRRRFDPLAILPALWLVAAVLVTAPTRAQAQATDGETLEQTLCRLIETGARRHNLPVHFFTRLIWAESSFRIGVVSPAGAQGVAQFMPGTARERGLADPFDPEQAIAASAALLADHVRQFGNLGLAAAAYNGGPTRVANFLEGRGGLPAETQDYVYKITGRTAQDWVEELRRATPPAGVLQDHPQQACLQVTALLRRPGGSLAAVEGPFAPWGVQLAGHFSKAIALASYGRARARLAGILGDTQPMIIGSRLRSRGASTFYRVRAPAPTRRAADALCDRIRAAGGACIVLRNGGRT